MHELMLLVDGSVNTRSQIGYGAYLAVTESGLPVETLRAQVKVRRFAPTSSTRLELQTLLWALSEVRVSGRKLVIYTDSQNIIGLPGRRQRLEQQDYRSSSKRRLNNAELYQEFFRLIDALDCELVKVRGHRLAAQKDEVDRLFTLVDRASRHALREEPWCKLPLEPIT